MTGDAYLQASKNCLWIIKMTHYHCFWGKTNRHSDEKGALYHLLPYHSLDVAAIAYVLLNQHSLLISHFSKLTGLTKEDFKQWAVFFMSLHDIGKFADSFQNLSPETLKQLQQRTSEREYSERHDSLGFLLWNEILREQFELLEILPASRKGRVSTQEEAINYWMAAVTGHHGEPPKTLSVVANTYFDQADFEAVNEYTKDIQQLFVKDTPFPDVDAKKLELASWWLSGLTVLCDWLGSNKDYFPYVAKEIPLDAYWRKSVKQAEKAIAKTGLLTPRVTAKLTLKQIINTHEPVSPTPLQQAAQEVIISDSPQLYILEDVTGAGKTEAAVILAHRLMQKESINGVYFALPTMATANAMYSRMASAYRHFYQHGTNKPSLILAHAASALSDQFSQSLMPENNKSEKNYGDNTTPAGVHCNQWLADNRKKSLLADIGVGTIDQVLLAILPSRHQSLRLFGLLDKVLIIDEVHACDAYMQTLLCALLKAHAASGGGVILLSATLAENQRQKLVNAYAEGQKWGQQRLQKIAKDDYPLLTSLDNKGIKEQVIATRKSVKRCVNIKLLHSIDAIETLFADVIAKDQCACWIRNTVIDACESYQWLKELHPEWNIDLFHARFAMGDRLNIENRVLESFGKNSTAQQRKGKILIATQVVEQSLDADWDELVTDLVPIDMII